MSLFGSDFPQRLLEFLKTAVSTFLLIVLYYILQYIFDMHFECSCRPGLHPNGVLYMLAPPVILTLVATIIEPFHQRRSFSSWGCCIFKCFKCCNSNFCGYILKLLIKYVGLNALWVTTVLFDGDWYFCLKTNFNTSQTGLPCKRNLTYEEQRIKYAYKTESLDIGFGVICGILLLWSIVKIRRAYCIQKNTWKMCSCSIQDLCPPYYSVFYEDVLEQQVSNELNNGLKKIATEKAEAICKPYLEAIEKHELSKNNTSDGNDNTTNPVSKVWSTISASDFYLMENETQENSHVGSDIYCSSKA